MHPATFPLNVQRLQESPAACDFLATFPASQRLVHLFAYLSLWVFFCLSSGYIGEWVSPASPRWHRKMLVAGASELAHTWVTTFKDWGAAASDMKIGSCGTIHLADSPHFCLSVTPPNLGAQQEPQGGGCQGHPEVLGLQRQDIPTLSHTARSSEQVPAGQSPPAVFWRENSQANITVSVGKSRNQTRPR